MLRNLLVVCGILSLLPGAARAEERLRDFHVLGFGIGRYAAGSELRLSAPNNDVSTLADYFTRQDFDSGRPRRAARLLFDDKAKKADIERELQDLPNWVADGGTLVILYSGHGLRFGGRWYLAPHDMQHGHVEDSAVSDTTILKAVDRLIEKRRCRVMMVMNSCHSGQFVVSARPLFDKYHDPAKGGLIIMASSAPNELTFGAAVYSVFNSALNSGLKMMQAHLYPTNSVSIKEIRRFLLTEVTEQIQFWFPKIPGVEWHEQLVLVECSLSIPETLGITWADPKFTVKVKTTVSFDEPAPVAVSHTGPTKSPVGKWICVRPLVRTFDPVTKQPLQFYKDASGKPKVVAILLTMDADGNYQVQAQDAMDRPVTGAGRWRILGGSRFVLTFENGVDSFTVDKLDDSSFEIRKVGPAMDLSLMTSLKMSSTNINPVWKFTRVVEKKK